MGLGELVCCFQPQSAIRSQNSDSSIVGYTFWTENELYHRLLALYTIAFDDQYRSGIVKDGISEYIARGESVPQTRLRVVDRRYLVRVSTDL